jgi:hypothetical protein
MRVNRQDLPKCTRKHPLTSLALAILLIITLINVIHDCRIGGDLLIVLIRDTKEEMRALGDVARRIRHDLTTWELEGTTRKGTAAGSPELHLQQQA